MNRRAHEFRQSALQEPLGCGVDQRDAPVEAGGDQPAADGVNNVFVQRLQAFQRPAGVLQLHSHLPQFCREQPGKICDCQEGKQVYEDDGLQRLQSGMRGAVGGNDAVVVQFQHGPVKNEGERRNQLRPHARQQQAGDNDDQGIEKVKRTVPSTGFVDDEADENQIGQNLQRGLQTVLLPEGEQKHVEQRKAVPEKNGTDEEPHGQRRQTEMGNRQLNREQEGQNENSDPDQPSQPIALVERRLH